MYKASNVSALAVAAELVVGLAHHPCCFEDLRDLVDRRLEVEHRGAGDDRQRHPHDRLVAAADGGPLELSGVAGDDPGGFEVSHSAKAGVGVSPTRSASSLFAIRPSS
jgi:hypothetical protein